VTLIEIEAIEQFAREYGHALDAAQSRRNLVTRGVRLNDLVGVEFFVGKVPMRGLRLCEPCAHLARLVAAPVLPGLIKRGGLYAQVLQDGVLAVGDPISIIALEK
jgi:MOSC domain-containing protein YiiM